MKNQKQQTAKPSESDESAVTKMVTGIFSKIQSKTGLSNEKIDQFQKSWLALPTTRKKYEHLTDAPVVAIEEGLAMANDILDYLEGQESGKSLVFLELKKQTSELVHHPVEFFKSKVAKAETFWKKIMEHDQVKTSAKKKKK